MLIMQRGIIVMLRGIETMAYKPATYTKLIGPNGEGYAMRLDAPRQTGNFGEPFMYIFSTELQKLSRDRELNGHALKVLFFAWEKLSFDKWRMISQAKWAEDIGVHQSTVGRCLRELKDRNHLQAQGSGPRTEWRLNPLAAWKGSANQFHAMRKQRGMKLVKLPPVAQAAFDVIDGGKA
jgi:hypothetical protein